MILLGMMNKIFDFKLCVVLMIRFYYIDSLFNSFDSFIDICTQTIFLPSKKLPLDFFHLQVVLLLYMRGSYTAKINKILVLL